MYEIRPDVFPYGYLTQTEIELWDLFYEERSHQNGGH